MSPTSSLLIWQLFMLLVLLGGGFVAFLVIRLLWRANFPKKHHTQTRPTDRV